MIHLSDKLCRISGMKYSMITGNGTSAIYLALMASGIPKGEYVAVPNIACPDPVYALIWAGYKPIFIDVNIEDYNIKVEHFQQEISNHNIKGLIAIHLFGNPCKADVLRDICNQNNIFMLEDCAQAVGNSYKGKPLGSYGDVSVFSFGNGKILEVGHGGSVQTSDEEIFSRMKSYYGKLPDFSQPAIDKLSKKHRSLYYRIYNFALKYPIADILNLIFVYRFKQYYLYKFNLNYLKQIGEKLDQLKINTHKRKKIVEDYQQLLISNKLVLPRLNSTFNALTRFTINVFNSEKIAAELRASGIPSNTMYPPLAGRFKMFPRKKNLGNSYKLKGRMLNLWVNIVENDQVHTSIKIIKKNTNE